jgi:hypothetical protein
MGGWVGHQKLGKQVKLDHHGLLTLEWLQLPANMQHQQGS